MPQEGCSGACGRMPFLPSVFSFPALSLHHLQAGSVFPLWERKHEAEVREFFSYHTGEVFGKQGAVVWLSHRTVERVVEDHVVLTATSERWRKTPWVLKFVLKLLLHFKLHRQHLQPFIKSPYCVPGTSHLTWDVYHPCCRDEEIVALAGQIVKCRGSKWLRL